MSTIKQDKYILGQSKDTSLEDIAKEIKIDIELKSNIYDIKGGRIYGKVEDKNGITIQYALITIMDINYTPVYHNFADENGNYSIENIQPGSYIIIAKAQGYKLLEKPEMPIGLGDNIEINFNLDKDTNYDLAIIAGDIVDSITNKPVSGAAISLYSTNLLKNEIFEAIAYTNEFGQYVFREVAQKSYIMRINSLGYIKTFTELEVTSNGQIIPLNVGITQDPNTAYGTISGIITNDKNMPIEDADVILYKIEDNNVETPLAFTKTNSSGAYLFIKVGDGNYKIISNKSEIISINVTKGVMSTIRKN